MPGVSEICDVYSSFNMSKRKLNKLVSSSTADNQCQTILRAEQILLLLSFDSLDDLVKIATLRVNHARNSESVKCSRFEPEPG